MKHIKEFESFGEIASYIVIGWAVYKFIKGILLSRAYKKLGNAQQKALTKFIKKVKTIDKLNVADLGDRFFIRFNDDSEVEYDLRLFKNEKLLKIDNHRVNEIELPLSQEQYDDFLKLIEK